MRAALGHATAKFQSVGNGVVADASVQGRDPLQRTNASKYEDTAPYRFFVGSDKLRPLSLLVMHAY